MPTIADYLKYANLQMAAEALFRFDATLLNANLKPGETSSDPLTSTMLEIGNRHTNKFTETEAAKFASEWTVIEHISNTTTGFSGTLFMNKVTREYTLSFRSTEFLDDAARDNQATNVLEIKEKGWAFGQISDMENWYQSIQSKIDGPLSVTGYSLGGHLATAFNLLHPGAADEVVTFNGAGVGKIGDGSLATTQGQLPVMIHTFQALRQEGESSGLLRLMQSSEGRDAYLALKAALAGTNGVPCQAGDANKFNGTLLNLVSQVKPALPDDPGATSREADYQLLWSALDRAKSVFTYAHWAPDLKSGTDQGPANPANIKDLDSSGKLAIAGESLDYQLAVLATATQYQTQPLGLIDGARAALGTPTLAPGWPLPNQWDLAGSETTTDPWYMVAYSQYRYGNNVNLFIEDQPFSRGNAVSETVKAMMAGRIQLLHNEYDKNDFGDTHSLVLLVDSLNIQNTLLQLAPATTQEALNTILKSASNLKAINGGGTQGKSEGDVLENVLNGLGRLLIGPESWSALYGAPEGNTWAKMEDSSGGNGEETVVYSGRNTFYENLKQLTDSAAFKALAGKLSLAPVDLASIKEKARTDFDAFATLYALSPFATGLTAGAGTTLEAAVSGAWGKVYTDWQADKTLNEAERAAGKAIYSEQWYADRSAFLGYWLQSTGQNVQIVQDGNAGLNSTDQRVFKQLDSGQKIIVQNSVNGETNTDKESQYILFGGNKMDLMAGGKLDDRFYGGGGLDYLDGKTGKDTLDGGAGLDFYRFKKGDGEDKVSDYREEIDGKRRARALLQRNNELLVLAYKDGVGWKGGTGENAFTAARSGNDLILSFTDNEDDRITLKDFDFEDAKGGRGSYGLRLIENESGMPGPVRSFIGDTEDWDRDGDATNGVQTKTDDFGNNLRADGQDGRPLIEQTNRADIFYGSTANETERFTTGDGNDLIHADGSDSILAMLGGIDLIDAGKGRDIVAAGGNNDRVEGSEGGDILGGNSGNDLLYADNATSLETAIKAGETAIAEAGEGDLITGDGGNDTLIGSARADALFGGLNSDIVVGGGGDDNLYGDGSVSSAMLEWVASRQEIEDGASVTYEIDFTNATLTNDPVSGDADVLIGGAGDDWMFAGGGDDLLLGGEGKDIGFGDAGDDVLQGGAGDDVLNGDSGKGKLPEKMEGNDILDGGDGEDTLIGNGGNDVLIGGKNNDTLVGGKGKDIYLYNKGDGEDILVDEPFDSNKADASVLILGEGIKREDVKFRKGSLWVDMGNGDGVHFENFDADNPYDTPVLGELRFADGQTMSYDDVLAQGFDLDGTDEDDYITGTAVTDRINGYEEGDALYGKGGDDVLAGGQGDDRVDGGGGDDTYLFNRGDGADLLVDESGADVLRLGEGIALEQLQISHFLATDGVYYLNLDFGDDDRVSIREGALGTLERVVFADGREMGWRDLVAMLPAIKLAGTDAGELLLGTAGNDVLDGMGGNDTLEAGAGDDVLIGGAGNDRLAGGAGRDTYRFGFGAGSDVLLEVAGEPSLLVFDGGVTPLQLTLARDGDDLLIGIDRQTDSVRLAAFFAGEQDWEFQFGQDESLSFAELAQQVAPEEGSVAALRDAYKAQIMADFSAVETAAGYSIGSDGKYHLETMSGNGYSWSIRSEQLHGLVFGDAAGTWGWRDGGVSRTATTKTVGNYSIDSSSVVESPYVNGQFVVMNGLSKGASSYGSEYVFVHSDGQIVGTWNLPSGSSLGPAMTSVVSFENTVYRADLLIPEFFGSAGIGDEFFSVDYREAYSGRSWNAKEAVGALVDGGDGQDWIEAVSDDDPLLAGRGAFLYGNDGDDQIFGGDADDILIGGRGADIVDGRHGGDTYYLLEDDAGDVVRDTGNDWERYKNWFYEQAGIEDIDFHRNYGGLWVIDFYEHLRTADTLEALIADLSERWSEAEVRQRAFYVSPLPVVPVIADNDYAALEALYGEGILREDRLRFADGVSADNLLVMGSEDPGTLGALLFRGPDGKLVEVALPESGGSAADGEAEMPQLGTGIEYYEFADGTVLTLRQMVDRMRVNHDVQGSDAGEKFVFDIGNDRVLAGGGDDDLRGGAGDDLLDGGDGDDSINGGRGTDVLVGGRGSDSYRFGWRSGHDTVIDAVTRESPDAAIDSNKIVFDDDVPSGDVRLIRLDNATRDLIISLGDNEASLTIVGWGLVDGKNLISEFEFVAEGLTWNLDRILNEIGRFNTLPDASAVVPGQWGATAGQMFSLTLPEALRKDAEGDQIFIELDGGLPEWLSFDAETLTFAGIPPVWAGGKTLPIGIRIADSFGGQEKLSIFDIVVADAVAISGGDGNDRLTGTAAANMLLGLAGDDRLSGLAGDDWLRGGEGNDQLWGGDGNDWLEGGVGNNSLFGDAGNDILNGDVGNDVLNGGIGADTMIGGAGSDTYYVDNAGDAVSELASEGTDRVISAISYTLGDNVENLTLSGTDAISGSGNELNNSIVGNAAANVLSGLGGNDSLTGGDSNDTLLGGAGNDAHNGGLGADTMAGGTDNDTYYVDNAEDVVTEFADEGTDRVISTISYTLGDNVENLTLSGTDAISGTGNELNNTLVGNVAANVLTGLGGNDHLTGGDSADTLLGGAGNDVLNGGLGADVMAGSTDNDTYYVDNAGDVVTEQTDEGTDRVVSTITYALGENLENLTLSGAEAIDGVGNAVANNLVGNAAANMLSGGEGSDNLNGGAGNDRLYGGADNDTLNGGAGADIMAGSVGNDTCYVDDIGDTVIEAANEGTDRVIATISHILADNLENLTLSGSNAIDGLGNALANSMTGNAASNLLNGHDGNDSLNGAAGIDFLEGMDGNDTLTDTTGSGYFNGGSGADRLTGSASADFFLGGTGNDTINTGAGNDLIAFNRGDGYDAISVGSGDKTISLGGNIAYSDLSLRKAGNDLVLDTGNGEGMALKNWYVGMTNQNVLNLQVISEAMAAFDAVSAGPLLNQRVQDFDFKALAGAFDSARTANPGLTSWALTDALMQFQLSASDSAALGGDLAYQYGRNGTLTGIGLTAAQQVIGEASFGSQAQALRPLAGLQEGAVRLS